MLNSRSHLCQQPTPFYPSCWIRWLKKDLILKEISGRTSSTRLCSMCRKNFNFSSSLFHEIFQIFERCLISTDLILLSWNTLCEHNQDLSRSVETEAEKFFSFVIYLDRKFLLKWLHIPGWCTDERESTHTQTSCSCLITKPSPKILKTYSNVGTAHEQLIIRPL